MDFSGFDAPSFQPSTNSGIGGVMQKQPGLFSRIVGGLTQAPKFFLNTDIVNPIKQIAAEATGNKVAENNALKSTLGGAKTPGQALEKIGGNAAQLGLYTIDPAAEGFTGAVAKNAALGAGFGATGAAGAGGSLQDILGGAKSGAITGGAVGGVLHGIGSIGNKLTTNAANQITKRADQAAAEEALAYKGVKPSIINNNNLAGATDFFKSKLNMGADPQSFANAAKITTGSDGWLSNAVKGFLGNADASGQTVDLTGLVDKTGRNAIKDNAGALPGEIADRGKYNIANQSSAANGLYNELTDFKQNTLLGGEGGTTLRPGGSGEFAKVGEVAAPSKVFDAIQAIDNNKLAPLSDLASKGNAQAKASFNVWSAVKSDLQDRLGSVGGIDKAVADYRVLPQDVTAIQEHVAQNGGSPELAQHIVDSLNNANSLQDLRSAQAPFVRASNIANAAQKVAQGQGFLGDVLQKGGKAGGDSLDLYRSGVMPATRGAMYATRNPLIGGGLLAYIGAKKLAGSGLAEAAGNAVDKVGNIAGGTGGEVASRLAVPAAVAATAPQPNAQQNAQQTSTQPQQAFSPGTQVSFANGQLQPLDTAGGGQGGQTSGIQGLSTDTIEKAMLADLGATGGKNLSKLTQLHSIAKSKEAQANPKLNQTAVNQADASQRAITGLNNIGQAFSSTGGTGEGALSRILGTSVKGLGVPGGGGVRDINTAISASLPDVAKALGLGTSQPELKQVANMLPNVGDNKQTANKKLTQLRDQITKYAQQYFSNESNFVNNGNQSSALDSLLGGLGATQ